jgi:acetyl-CoA C-acetyltransferase
MNTLLDRTPVIVGVGEIIQRTKDPAQAMEPLALMEAAIRAADQDAGGGLLTRVDSLDIVAEYSWPYADAPAQLSQRLQIQPARQTYGAVGGESPVRFIHEAALRIWRGETTVAVVAGAEANYAVAAAAKQKATLPWSPRDANAKLVRGVDYLNPLAVRLGVASPPTVYPFYENAASAAWGQTPRQALAESGQLWAGCSAVAASNPYAWQREALTAEEITTPTASNRLVAWPYTVRMVANPLVNQGAAVLLMSRGQARQLGIPDQRMVFVWCGAAAKEPSDYLHRDQYQRSFVQETVLETVMGQVGGVGNFKLLELYSCFPVVPKMARRTLALPADATVTSTGGLSFFGAPLNNYMTHACAALVRGLREQQDTLSLLYGQGGYLTNHHAIVLASRPPPPRLLSDSYDVQTAADARRGDVPPLQLDYIGDAVLETHTVLYARDGAPTHGAVILRTPQGGRLLARVHPEERNTIDRLTDADLTPIGRRGMVTQADDGTPHWRIQA